MLEYIKERKEVNPSKSVESLGLKKPKWSPNTCSDGIHRCLDPYAVSRTILCSQEVKRQNLLYRIRLAEKGDRLILLRRLNIKEQRFIQHVPVRSRFPNSVSKSKKHAMIGNAMPARFAACILKGILGGSKMINRTYLDLFSGIGGMAMGFHYTDEGWFEGSKATTKVKKSDEFLELDEIRKKKLRQSDKFIEEPLGFECLGLVEMDKDCAKVLRKNANKPSSRWKRKRVMESRLESTSLARFEGKLGVLTGGPPCQSFSKMGNKKGLSDPRSGWVSCAKTIFLTEPEYFVFENAPFLLSYKKFVSEDLKEIKEMISNPFEYLKHRLDDYETGSNELDRECRRKMQRLLLSNETEEFPYPFKWFLRVCVLDAVDYGVCQNRERAIFVGKRVNSDYKSNFFDQCTDNPFVRIQSQSCRNDIVPNDVVKAYCKKHPTSTENWMYLDCEDDRFFSLV